ncbi:MAG: hypothetical protein ACI9VS_002298 [Candidatus Binatia bacterium]|jgi:hypothetical protein
MKYSALHKIIQDLEITWQAQFTKACPQPPSNAANREIQFFSVESQDGKRTDLTVADADLPVVVGVGINYWQRPIQPQPQPKWPIPHLGRNSNNDPEVVDNTRSNMRSFLDLYLKRFASLGPKFKKDWLRHGLVSSINIPTFPSSRYYLVATNLSPVLTRIAWQEHTPTEQQPLRNLCRFDHLNDLFSSGFQDALWVGHGKAEIWPVFPLWMSQLPPQNSGSIHWLLTENLGRSHPAIALPRFPGPPSGTPTPSKGKTPTKLNPTQSALLGSINSEETGVVTPMEYSVSRDSAEDILREFGKSGFNALVHLDPGKPADEQVLIFTKKCEQLAERIGVKDQAVIDLAVVYAVALHGGLTATDCLNKLYVAVTAAHKKALPDFDKILAVGPEKHRPSVGKTEILKGTPNYDE